MSSPALLDHLVQHINADVFHFFLVLIASSNALNLFSHSSQSHSDAKVKTKVLELIRDWKGATMLNLCLAYRELAVIRNQTSMGTCTDWRASIARTAHLSAMESCFLSKLYACDN